MTETTRYFLSYGGVRLPLNLLGPLGEADIRNRNTFIRARYDGEDRLVQLEKIVYGDVHLTHRYAYHRNGLLKQAEITMVDEEDEVTILTFDEMGQPVPG